VWHTPSRSRARALWPGRIVAAPRARRCRESQTHAARVRAERCGHAREPGRGVSLARSRAPGAFVGGGLWGVRPECGRTCRVVEAMPRRGICPAIAGRRVMVAGALAGWGAPYGAPSSLPACPPARCADMYTYIWA